VVLLDHESLLVRRRGAACPAAARNGLLAAMDARQQLVSGLAAVLSMSPLSDQDKIAVLLQQALQLNGGGADREDVHADDAAPSAQLQRSSPAAHPAQSRRKSSGSGSGSGSGTRHAERPLRVTFLDRSASAASLADDERGGSSEDSLSADEAQAPAPGVVFESESKSESKSGSGSGSESQSVGGRELEASPVAQEPAPAGRANGGGFAAVASTVKVVSAVATLREQQVAKRLEQRAQREAFKSNFLTEKKKRDTAARERAAGMVAEEQLLNEAVDDHDANVAMAKARQKAEAIEAERRAQAEEAAAEAAERDAEERRRKAAMGKPGDMGEAARRGDIERLRLQMEAGVNPNSEAERDHQGNGPLHLAASGGYADCVELLVHGHDDQAPDEVCADVDAPDQHSCTPLMHAARDGWTECCRVLVDAGADLDALTASEGRTALMCAASRMEGPCVDLLLDAGADERLVASGGNIKGKTALQIARDRWASDTAAKQATLDVFSKHKILQ